MRKAIVREKVYWHGHEEWQRQVVREKIASQEAKIKTAAGEPGGCF